MKTLLIPVDSSEATENVIKYAADFSCDTHVDRIILLKSYYVSVYAQLLPSADFVQLNAEDIDEERQKVVDDLKSLGQELVKKCNPSIKIKTAISELPLIRAIHQIIANEQPYVLMIGNDTSLDDSYIAEQLIAIAKTSTVPVLIVPSTVKYKKIERTVVPCDLSAISRLNALQGFRDPTRFLHPDLMILNVGPKPKGSDEHLAASLAGLLDGYKYEVYYSEDKDIVHGIVNFAARNHAQMITALPGKYSFFSNLTHRSKHSL